MLVNVKLKRGFRFEVADFIGLVYFEWHNQTKLAILAFLYGGEFVKKISNGIVLLWENIAAHGFLFQE